ncbi:hypothetical protein [Burkholderia gladioli]|uniref:hypothetical protein n=1 Tax=Burkholderia gladioli TaxID=28095 RepID=UPI0016409D0C|nr:hypothetical protein [Burkholderia gladioli]
MAASDYRSCDVCGGKAFYDAHLDYQFAGDTDFNGEKITAEKCAREVGEPQPWGYKLQYLGDWAVICNDCAKTHRTEIVRITTEDGK